MSVASNAPMNNNVAARHNLFMRRALHFGRSRGQQILQHFPILQGYTKIKGLYLSRRRAFLEHEAATKIGKKQHQNSGQELLQKLKHFGIKCSNLLRNVILASSTTRTVASPSKTGQGEPSRREAGIESVVTYQPKNNSYSCSHPLSLCNNSSSKVLNVPRNQIGILNRQQMPRPFDHLQFGPSNPP